MSNLCETPVTTDASTSRHALFRHVPKEEMERLHSLCLEIREVAHRPRTYFIVTYGCQMNAHDSEKLAGILDDCGMCQAATREEADLVLFNTCAVRENAERRALGNVTWLKELRRTRPEMLIGVCGCMIQQPGMAETILKQYRFIDLAFGTSNAHLLPEMLFDLLNGRDRVVRVSDEDVLCEGQPARRLRQDAAYINITYGCDNFCSYCVVPLVRGRERSREKKAILEEAAALAESGVREIMLLGQNVNSYGKTLSSPSSFADLLRDLDALDIPRIRFMTSHPKDLSDELIEVMASSRHILPQFHLPVQSGNDEILRRMNRHYTIEKYLERVAALRRAIPGIGLSTDIIVGFPGETEAQFEDTMQLVRTVRYDSAFTFVYSPRRGTRAATMPGQIPEDVSGDRIKRLIDLQEELQKETLKRFLGMEEKVLVEGTSRRSAEAVSGKGTHAVSVTLPGTREDIGQIVSCRITGIKNNTLMAERL